MGNRFQYELGLTERDVHTLIGHLTRETGISFPTDTARNLTDVFDLMVYILLRSTEYTDVETYFSALLYPILQLSPDEFRPFGVALLHQINLN